MEPANDPSIDYKAVVRRGYDRCANAYAATRQRKATPELAMLTSRLPAEATVLDVGCGTGIPIAMALADQYQVVGVDISSVMIHQARENLPNVNFINGDIMAVEFQTGQFEGIVMFYTLFHLPRQEHPELLRRCHRWLKPGGYLLATLTYEREEPYLEKDFFGATMYWSNWGLEDYLGMLEGSGFALLETSSLGHGYRETYDGLQETHPIILAQKALRAIQTPEDSFE